jgi:hypothetical protein
MIVISDASKRVITLGQFPLPVEVVRFGNHPQHGRGAGRRCQLPGHHQTALRLTADRSRPMAASS